MSERWDNEKGTAFTGPLATHLRAYIEATALDRFEGGELRASEKAALLEFVHGFMEQPLADCRLKLDSQIGDAVAEFLEANPGAESALRDA